MIAEALAFYTLAAYLIFFAFKTITVPNPVHSALYLVLTMIGLAAAFFQLNAQFIAGVQLIVYAGAVMVLFVMVLMLFDLKTEIRAFSKGLFSGVLKIAAAAMLVGLTVGAAVNSVGIFEDSVRGTLAERSDITASLAQLLFTHYLFSFEILGLLLLVVAVGVVALSRIKGGTHDRNV